MCIGGRVGWVARERRCVAHHINTHVFHNTHDTHTNTHKHIHASHASHAVLEHAGVVEALLAAGNEDLAAKLVLVRQLKLFFGRPFGGFFPSLALEFLLQSRFERGWSHAGSKLAHTIPGIV